MYLLEAQFEGTCAECEKMIDLGELITPVEYGHDNLPSRWMCLPCKANHVGHATARVCNQHVKAAVTAVTVPYTTEVKITSESTWSLKGDGKYAETRRFTHDICEWLLADGIRSCNNYVEWVVTANPLWRIDSVDR